MYDVFLLCQNSNVVYHLFLVTRESQGPLNIYDKLRQIKNRTNIIRSITINIPIHEVKIKSKLQVNFKVSVARSHSYRLARRDIKIQRDLVYEVSCCQQHTM
jgi:hypothetical protein